MADHILNISEFLDQSDSLPVIDVRSPAEYEHGHISGSVNLPLFSNEERSLVGTLYLHRGSSEAMMKGLELIGPKMREYASRAMCMAPGREALLHCWRGGMRSNSMAWLLNTIGIKTSTLEGGYKSFRRYVHSFFTKPVNLVVIGGMTGSGKTDVLEALESKGKQVIHLERLARHKGSVFGGLGMPLQPTTEQFENDLFMQLRQLNPGEFIYIEDESLAIGKVFIPRAFYEQMSSARYLKLIVPLRRRIDQLAASYAFDNKDLLISGVKRIEKRLGLENAAFATGLIRDGNLAEAVKVLLQYYDKVYARSMKLQKHSIIKEIRITKESPAEIAEEIIHLKQ